ncbi:MAG: hypothetical protein WDW36_000941 [Sanguina aurantia]
MQGRPATGARPLAGPGPMAPAHFPAGSLHAPPPPPPPPASPSTASPTPYGSIAGASHPAGPPHPHLDAAHAAHAAHPAHTAHTHAAHPNGHGSLSGSLDSASGRPGSLAQHLAHPASGTGPGAEAVQAAAAAAAHQPAQLLTRDKSIPTHAWQPPRSAQSSGTPLAGPPRGMTAAPQQQQAGGAGGGASGGAEHPIGIAASAPPWANMLSPIIPANTPAFSWAKLVTPNAGPNAAISPELAEAILKGEVAFDKDGCIIPGAMPSTVDKHAAALMSGVTSADIGGSSKHLAADLLPSLEGMLDAKLRQMELRITESCGLLMQKHQADLSQMLVAWLNAHGSHVTQTVHDVVAQQSSGQVESTGRVMALQLQPIHSQMSAIYKQALQPPPVPGPLDSGEVQLALQPLLAQMALIQGQANQQMQSLQQMQQQQLLQLQQQQMLRQQLQQQQQQQMPAFNSLQHTPTSAAGPAHAPPGIGGQAAHGTQAHGQASSARAPAVACITAPGGAPGLPFAVAPLPGLQLTPRGTGPLTSQGRDMVDVSGGATPLSTPPGLAPFPGLAPLPGLAPPAAFASPNTGSNHSVESSPDAQHRRFSTPHQQPHSQPQQSQQQPQQSQQQPQQSQQPLSQRQQQQDQLPAAAPDVSSSSSSSRGAAPRQAPVASPPASAAAAAASAAQAGRPDSGRRSVFARLGDQSQPGENMAGYPKPSHGAARPAAPTAPTAAAAAASSTAAGTPRDSRASRAPEPHSSRNSNPPPQTWVRPQTGMRIVGGETRAALHRQPSLHARLGRAQGAVAGGSQRSRGPPISRSLRVVVGPRVAVCRRQGRGGSRTEGGRGRGNAAQ